MPNWCMNRVEVYGTNEDIENFREYVKQGDLPFSFQTINPMPEELKDTHSPSGEPNVDLINKYGVDNWYDWCTTNWGVKWDIAEISIESEEHEDHLIYNFDTPWGPPEPIYDILVDKFPDISISWFYDEPGMQMAGYLGQGH